MSRMRHVSVLAIVLLLACGRRSDEGPVPALPLAALGGQRVLVLPVHYVQGVAGGWLGGAASSDEARRGINAEIAFALGEREGTTQWVLPAEIEKALGREPGLGLRAYPLSSDPIRRANAGRLERVGDPLYGEVRKIAALLDARYVLFPVELLYETPRSKDEVNGHAALWTVLFDARTGLVMWSGTVRGDPGPAGSGATVARAAQALARRFAP